MWFFLGTRYLMKMKTQKIRLTKQFTFEAAHALKGYDGKCRHIHGHSYILFVTVCGYPYIHDSPKLGMVMDFGELKKIVNELIINRFDHSLMLREGASLEKELLEGYGCVEIFSFQPTCENMLIYFADLIKPHLPPNIMLHSLRLHETATSFAEWFNSDNQ